MRPWWMLIAGIVAGLIFGPWGLILALGVALPHAAGRWGVLVGVVLFPVTYLAAPWYAALA